VTDTDRDRPVMASCGAPIAPQTMPMGSHRTAGHTGHRLHADPPAVGRRTLPTRESPPSQTGHYHTAHCPARRHLLQIAAGAATP
jgi:hypothetical protein